ncbi:MAG: TolC family protein [Chitinophagales bacterium]
MFKYLFIVMALPCQMILGQSKPSNQQKKNSNQTALVDTSRITDIRERLVELALQNPTYEMSDLSIRMARYVLSSAKASWLGIITVSGNINEFTIFPAEAGNNQSLTLYPRYNIGASIPLDIFWRIPNNVKIARVNVAMAQAQKNDRFRQIKAEVLTKYEDYVMTKQLLDFQVQVTQDQYALYKRAEKDYSDGIIKLEEFDRAYKDWVAEQARKLTLQRGLNVIKIDMERMIGVRFDDVLAQMK